MVGDCDVRNSVQDEHLECFFRPACHVVLTEDVIVEGAVAFSPILPRICARIPTASQVTCGGLGATEVIVHFAYARVVIWSVIQAQLEARNHRAGGALHHQTCQADIHFAVSDGFRSARFVLRRCGVCHTSDCCWRGASVLVLHQKRLRPVHEELELLQRVAVGAGDAMSVEVVKVSLRPSRILFGCFGVIYRDRWRRRGWR